MKYASCSCDLRQNSLRLFGHCMKNVPGTLDRTQMKRKLPLLPSDLYSMASGEPKMLTMGLVVTMERYLSFLVKLFICFMREHIYLKFILENNFTECSIIFSLFYGKFDYSFMDFFLITLPISCIGDIVKSRICTELIYTIIKSLTLSGWEKV